MDKTQFDPSRPEPPPPSEPPHELRKLGEYRLMRRLGEGGMGAVYLGYHEGSDVQVAIKVLNDGLASSQGFVDRFYREAKSGALLNHPNIVRTLNVGQDRATRKHYLVLELVDGISAHALLDLHGHLSVGDAVHVTLDIARALEHAQSRNIVHRDIKPDNILITRSGVSKLADLGLAKRIDETSHLTATRQGFGTTHYMPYEQAINAKYADGRSDIYALGATLYHLVTGALPFTGDNHLEVVEKKNQGDYAPASALNPEVPAVLDQILARMLARQPRNRYQTASELIVELERSRLAVPVPSFADPDQARQDAWVQACLASSAEPTRLDPESQARAATPVEADDGWLVRFHNSKGQLCKARATTKQLVQRLKEGRLPADVEACRPGEKAWKPLRSYAEFESVRPAARAARRRAQPAPSKDGRALKAAPPRRRWGLILAGAAVLLAVLLAALYGLVLRPS